MTATNLDAVVSWMGSLEQLRTSNSCGSPNFYRPYHFATLAAEMRIRNQPFGIPKSMQAYATRMHLWQAIDQPAPKQVREGPSMGRFMPLQPLKKQSDVDQVASDLTQIVREQSGGESSLQSVRSSLSELLNNCFDHSESSDGHYGLACAQAWPRDKRAQVAIVDTGIGIRRTLAQNTDYAKRLAEDNACLMATEYGISGKLGENHSGYGLALARDILKPNGGCLVVISQYELFFTSPQMTTAVRLRQPWQGTAIIFEWRTDRDLSAKGVYDSWPDSWYDEADDQEQDQDQED